MTASYPNSLHYAVFAEQLGNDPVEDFTNGCYLRFREFEGGKEIETEEDTGHTGSRSLIQDKIRTKATAEPKITDAIRMEQGAEDMCYHVLGKYTKTVGTGADEGVNIYEISPSEEIPKVSILHGFNHLDAPANIYANSIGNELTFTFNAEEAPTLEASYISDFPLFKDIEPTLSYKATAPKALKAGNLKVKIGATSEAPANIPVAPCITEGEITISNNAESSVCAGDTFGKVSVDVQAMTVEGNITFKWNPTNKIEREWATNSSTGEMVSEKSYYRQIIVSYEGTYDDGKPLSIEFAIPEAYIDSVSPSESGEDAKTVEIEFSGITGLASTDIVKVKCKSKLTDMHKETEP